MQHLPSDQQLALLRSIFPQGIVFVDIESSGLSPLFNDIIEIGALKVTAQKIEQFNQLVKIDRPLSPYITELTGITDQMLYTAPSLSAVMQNFISFRQNLPLVAHNAPFDMGHLFVALRKNLQPTNFSQFYCSCRFARRTTKADNYKLKTLIDTLNIKLSAQYHRALFDSLACLQLTITLLNEQNVSIFLNSNVGGENISLPSTTIINSQDIIEQNNLLITYTGGSIRGPRPVKAIALIPYPNAKIYLYTLCLLTNQYKNFDLSKITEVAHA